MTAFKILCIIHDNDFEKLFEDEYMKKVIFFCLMSLLVQVVYPTNFGGDFYYAGMQDQEMTPPHPITPNPTTPTSATTASPDQEEELDARKLLKEAYELMLRIRQFMDSKARPQRPFSPCNQQ